LEGISDMTKMRIRLVLGTALAAVGLLVSAGAANASRADNLPIFAPNYTFADGAKGFALTTSGGPINPGVIVGFNPQPDPPGDGDDGALIALLNPADPQLFSPAIGGSFTFLIGLLMPGDGSVLPLPDAPNTDGRTGERFMLGGHLFDIGLAFSGPGPVDPGSWVGFNPQPEPPGDVLGVGFSFTVQGDPFATFNISIDGQALDFALAPGVPEPATWGLMLMGFGGLGAALRSRRRAMLAAA
jgi:hypothetical protein